MTITVQRQSAAPSQSPIVAAMATAQAKSTASLVADPTVEVRVIGPKPLVELKPNPNIKSGGEQNWADQEMALNRTPPNDLELVISDVPSTPIPPIPSPRLVAAALADAASPVEMLTQISTPTQLATTPLPERSVQFLSIESEPVSFSQFEIPLPNASRPKIIPNTTGESPGDQNKEKKHPGWKATPPERRKTITMEDKTPRTSVQSRRQFSELKQGRTISRAFYLQMECGFSRRSMPHSSIQTGRRNACLSSSATSTASLRPAATT